MRIDGLVTMPSRASVVVQPLGMFFFYFEEGKKRKKERGGTLRRRPRNQTCQIGLSESESERERRELGGSR